MRRMWMLLLTVALMAVVLAVPAMAAEIVQVDGEWPTVTSCPCGMVVDGVGTHIDGCTEEEVVWSPWTTTNSLPTSGNYYLAVETVTIPGQVKLTAGTTDAQSYLRLNLNGNTITTSVNRGFWLQDYSTLVITDTAGGGQFVNTANHDQGGVAWLNGTNTIFYLYAGKMDASGFSNRSSAAEGGVAVAVANSTSRFYMYGGELYGSRVDDPETDEVEGFTAASAPSMTTVGAAASYTRQPAFFGAVYVCNGAIFEMHGGTIYGGTVQGGIYAKVSNNIISAVKATGGVGAAVYIASGGTVNLYGGTIHGGEAINASVTSYDSEGTATTKSAGGMGGAICQVGGTLNIYGGTVKGGSASSQGGNLYLNGGTVNMQGGTIQDGTSNYGGNIYVYSGSVILSEHETYKTTGTISGGSAPKNGGSISIQPSGSFTMSAGLITGGRCTTDQGGNIFCSGSISLTGGTISNGYAKNNGGNVTINSSKTVKLGAVTITGGEAGGDYKGGNLSLNINQAGELTFDLEGITVKNPVKGYNLYILTNTYKAVIPYLTINISDCTLSDADDGAGILLANSICKVDTSNNAVTDESEWQYPTIALNVSGDSVIGGKAVIQASSTYKEGITVTYTGYPVNNYHAIYKTMAQAVTVASAEGSYLTLNDNYTDALNVDDLTVDLNGYSLSNVTATGTVKLLDSSAAGYEVGSGSASITGGTVVTDFLTGSLTNYGHNYRFITVQDAEGKYTSHRIYLAVKATILYPGVAPYIGYRTALRCDDTIAALINAEGGEYGLLLNSVYTDYNKTAGAYVTDSTDNSTRVKLDNLLGDDETKYEERSTATVFANAYIKIGSSTYTSANSTAHSLKSLTEAIVALDQSTIGESAKTALGQMYDTYSSFMAAWTGVADVLDGYYTAE